jgi:hypothetical protein
MKSDRRLIPFSFILCGALIGLGAIRSARPTPPGAAEIHSLAAAVLDSPFAPTFCTARPSGGHYLAWNSGRLEYHGKTPLDAGAWLVTKPQLLLLATRGRGFEDLGGFEERFEMVSPLQLSGHIHPKIVYAWRPTNPQYPQFPHT